MKRVIERGLVVLVVLALTAAGLARRTMAEARPAGEQVVVRPEARAQTVPVPRRHAIAAGIENRLGAMLTTIEADGPAGRAGLMSHDLVVRLDGEPVTGIDDMIRLLDRNRIGKRVTIEVLRLGRLREFEVVPAERVANPSPPSP